MLQDAAFSAIKFADLQPKRTFTRVPKVDPMSRAPLAACAQIVNPKDFRTCAGDGAWGPHWRIPCMKCGHVRNGVSPPFVPAYAKWLYVLVHVHGRMRRIIWKRRRKPLRLRGNAAALFARVLALSAGPSPNWSSSAHKRGRLTGLPTHGISIFAHGSRPLRWTQGPRREARRRRVNP